MLMANTLMRHLLIDKDFKYRKVAEYEAFKLHEKLSLNEIIVRPDHWKIYLNILAQVMDDELPGEHLPNGEESKPIQAFRLNNVAKMALAT